MWLYTGKQNGKYENLTEDKFLMRYRKLKYF